VEELVSIGQFVLFGENGSALGFEFGVRHRLSLRQRAAYVPNWSVPGFGTVHMVRQCSHRRYST
jgi:hypothetical protein